MDGIQITSLILLFMICLVITTLIIIKLINKYLLLQHHIQLEMQKKLDEPFHILTEVEKENNDDNLKVITKCENKSLNEMHHRNVGIVESGKTMIDSKELNKEDAEKYSKTLKFPLTYTADTSKQGIMGANYMMYNNNPNPYHIDYPLVDKSTKVVPVGVNYVQI